VLDPGFTFPGEKHWTGKTSTYPAIKVAYHMGFSRVLLFGMDHDAKWEHFNGYPQSESDDAARKRMRENYAAAEAAFRNDDRIILNFSKPSELDQIFQRGTPEDL
jgi:hypothetical protein